MIDCGYGFDPCKTTTRHNKSQEGLFDHATIAFRFLQVSDDVVPQSDRVAKRFHCQRALVQPGDTVKVRD